MTPLCRGHFLFAILYMYSNEAMYEIKIQIIL
jgi:hypothetical protein